MMSSIYCFQVLTCFNYPAYLLLQVLPSAALSYLVYEFMKIVLKVEPTYIVNPIKKESGVVPAT